MSWSEQNRKGDVDSYINYLKSTGTLADVAKEELEALKEKMKKNVKLLLNKLNKLNVTLLNKKKILERS